MTQTSTRDLASLPEGNLEFVRGADGSRLRAVWAGTGPTVILAHGYLLDLTIYNLIFPELVKLGYRVIAFDQRGHGESSAGSEGFRLAAAAGDYGAVLQHFEVRDGQLVAHSMSSFLALVFCIQQPVLARERLSRLTLLGGNAGAVARGSLPNRLQIPLLKSGLMPSLWRSGTLGRAIALQLFGPRPEPRFVEATRQLLTRNDVRRSLPLLEAMVHEDFYSHLAEVSIPTQVLCGSHDRTCPRWHSERLGKELPQARNRWLADVGHMLSYEAPAAVLEAIGGR